MQDKEKNKEQPGILETVHMVNEKEKKKNEEERLRLEKEEEIEREEYSLLNFKKFNFFFLKLM